MKRKLVIQIIVPALFIVFILTVANLVLSGVLCGSGPSIQCEGWANRQCRTICGKNNCDGVMWDGSYCEHGICYEVWIVFCKDGTWHLIDDCISTYVCPI